LAAVALLPLVAAAATIAAFSRVAAVHPAIPVAIGAAAPSMLSVTALLVLRVLAALALLVLALALMLAVALMLSARRLGGGGQSDDERYRANDDLHDNVSLGFRNGFEIVRSVAAAADRLRD
jgi:hypothetical protein